MHVLNIALNRGPLHPAAKRPNPLHPDHMTPAERRAELCSLLSIGLIRLKHREESHHDTEGDGVRRYFTPAESLDAVSSCRRAV